MNLNKTEQTQKAGFVSIIGKPNAGKSTLMNSILGTKLSIVTPKAQTTRKRVLGFLTEDDCQIVFVDTPGVINPKYEMQRQMMNYVVESINEADILIIIIDLEKYKSWNEYFHSNTVHLISEHDGNKILLLNKTDSYHDKKELLPIISEITHQNIFDEIIPISALKNDNVDKVVEIIKKYLPANPFYYDPELLSSHPERFFVSELIRERIFMEYQEEIPYSTEVNVVEFKERQNGKWYISADIIIERDTQKGIIIGNKGSKIKQVGEKARIEIEEHLGMPVYLELFVKVRNKWRDNPNMLKSFGY
jgi:GTP-binding protein Era